jgi:hypothetical protein
MSRIVEVLKSGDSEAIKKIGDASPPPAILLHESPASAGQLVSEQNSGDDTQSLPAQGAGENVRQGSAASEGETAEVARGTFTAGKGRSSKAKRGAAARFEHGDLRGIVARGALSSPPASHYQSLVQAGFIKPSREFLD